MRRASCAATIVVFLLLANESNADFVAENLSGIFINPSGGVNSGVGTSFFSTGLPFGVGGAPNTIEFTPAHQIIFETSTLDVPSQMAMIGTFSFSNGVTETGTAASSVSLLIDGLGTITNIHPNIILPIGGFSTIRFEVTPNLTGDPFLDADFWILPTSAGMRRLIIPEGAHGTLNAYGRLVPQNFGLLPQDYLFEFTRFESVDGLITVEPIPEPSTFVLLFVALTLLGTGRVIRARS